MTAILDTLLQFNVVWLALGTGLVALVLFFGTGYVYFALRGRGRQVPVLVAFLPAVLWIAFQLFALVNETVRGSVPDCLHSESCIPATHPLHNHLY